jgi:hypothetical protein
LIFLHVTVDGFLAVTRNVDQNTDRGLFFATDHLGKKIKIRLNLRVFPAIVHLYEAVTKITRLVF